MTKSTELGKLIASVSKMKTTKGIIDSPAAEAAIHRYVNEKNAYYQLFGTTLTAVSEADTKMREKIGDALQILKSQISEAKLKDIIDKLETADAFLQQIPGYIETLKESSKNL